MVYFSFLWVNIYIIYFLKFALIATDDKSVIRELSHLFCVVTRAVDEIFLS
jgi:hypothetical protein